MPIFVDPLFTLPPAPDTSISADGILRVTVDRDHGGVLLVAVYTTPTPYKVRFCRADGTTVRSGDAAWAPGGYAVAYDHEIPLGVAAQWYAVPVDAAGIAGAPSLHAAVTVPEIEDGGMTDTWVKSTVDAGLSMRLWQTTAPVVTRAGRVTLSPIAGAAFPAATWDLHAASGSQFTFGTDTLEQVDAMEALTDAGPVLIQMQRSTGRRDRYYLLGDIEEAFGIDDLGTDPRRIWTVPAQEVARPATLDAPLIIPGSTYAALPDQFVTYDVLTAQIATYLALVGSPSV